MDVLRAADATLAVGPDSCNCPKQGGFTGAGGTGNGHAFAAREDKMLHFDDAPPVRQEQIDIFEVDIGGGADAFNVHGPGAAERLRLLDRRIE
jgi:hypothetical protein